MLKKIFNLINYCQHCNKPFFFWQLIPYYSVMVCEHCWKEDKLNEAWTKTLDRLEERNENDRISKLFR